MQELQTTAFGELAVAQPTPITQISAQYGLLDNVLTVLDDASSGSVSTDDEKYTCETGTASDGLASILTLRQLAYRAGQGAEARFTALFTAGVVDCNQAAGLITAENILAFGYVGTEFGIIYARDGHDELQELTLILPGTAAEVVTVTVDAIEYTVTLSGVGTTDGDAYDIAVSLSAQVPNYTFTSNNNQVVAQAVISQPQGIFVYNAPGASLGSWSQLVAGAAGETTFIPQSLWNESTRMDGEGVEVLDPTMGNVYQIKFQYLGFGAINFYVEDSGSGDFVLVHRIKFANTSTSTSMNNPTFRIGWLVRNVGNTTNITTGGGSAGAFIEGRIFRDNPPRSNSNNQLSVGTSLTNIFSLRNRSTFDDKVNRAEIFPLLITASTQSTKFAFFRLIANATFSAPVTWGYENKAGSIAETALDSVGVSGGREVGTITVVKESPGEVRFNITLDTNTFILPGSWMTIAAEIPIGAANDCQASLTWQEDL